MRHPYLINLNNPNDWLYPIEIFGPDGTKGEDQRTIFVGFGEHKLFCVTDSVMYPGDPDALHVHEHYKGYEDFFVDSGGMDLYVNGKKTYVAPGSLIHLQPYEAHGMFFHEPTKYRGFFHDLSNSDNSPDFAILRAADPELAKDPKFFELVREGFDSGNRERLEWVEAPAEEVAAVRHISRPMAVYELPGVTMKMIVGRWENGGVCEMWAAEMKKGFTAKWVKYPRLPELYYITAGEVKFNVLGEEFVAGAECVVKLPKYVTHSIEALTDAVVYDVGGLTRWYAFLQDRSSIMKFDPERAKKPETIEELKRRFGCQIESIGMK